MRGSVFRRRLGDEDPLRLPRSPISCVFRRAPLWRGMTMKRISIFAGFALAVGATEEGRRRHA